MPEKVSQMTAVKPKEQDLSCAPQLNIKIKVVDLTGRIMVLRITKYSSKRRRLECCQYLNSMKISVGFLLAVLCFLRPYPFSLHIYYAL